MRERERVSGVGREGERESSAEVGGVYGMLLHNYSEQA